jgi:hypothetical protein
MCSSAWQHWAGSPWASGVPTQLAVLTVVAGVVCLFVRWLVRWLMALLDGSLATSEVLRLQLPAEPLVATVALRLLLIMLHESQVLVALCSNHAGMRKACSSALLTVAADDSCEHAQYSHDGHHDDPQDDCNNITTRQYTTQRTIECASHSCKGTPASDQT